MLRRSKLLALATVAIRAESGSPDPAPTAQETTSEATPTPVPDQAAQEPAQQAAQEQTTAASDHAAVPAPAADIGKQDESPRGTAEETPAAAAEATTGNETDSSITATSENKTDTISDTIMSNLTVTWVVNITGPTTFTGRAQGGQMRHTPEHDRARRVKTFELTNVKWIGDDAEKGIRAFKKKMQDKALVLVRDAPQKYQSYVAETWDEAAARDGEWGAENRVPNATKYPKTILDAWLFEGVHIGQTLVDEYPQLYQWAEEEDQIEVDEDIQRAQNVVDRIVRDDLRDRSDNKEALTEEDFAQHKTKLLETDETLQKLQHNRHIMQKATSFVREYKMKTLQELLATVVGKEKANEALNGGAAGSGNKKTTGNKKKEGNKSGAKEKKSFFAKDFLQYLSAIFVVIVVSIGAACNFGRGQKKYKTKPSRAFIEREQRSL
ncbi:unnamed protein product [Amoebophrya sp. A120]|nr:unnamed protein product [Amoebophrya sp. A120]|eukprot:GSA120T00016842001.1